MEFTARALEDIVVLAEEKCGKTLPRKLAFRWLGRYHSLVTENIAECIVQRVYVDEEHIYPCVDIGVGDLLDDGSLLVVASVAGYAPRPFGKNWTGLDGPYVRIVGQAFLERMAGREPHSSPDGIFGFITPDMKNLR
jgi:hypothetical protein